MSKKPTSSSIVKVTRKVVKATPTTLYHLHIDGMTELEARALMTVLNHVGGDPKGLRGMFEQIRNSLIDQGITSNSLDCVEDNDASIYFNDIPVVTPLHAND